jgi:hypothetical protein
MRPVESHHDQVHRLQEDPRPRDRSHRCRHRRELRLRHLRRHVTRVGKCPAPLRAIRVLSNDKASYSEVLGLAYIAADESVDRAKIHALLAHLSGLPGKKGYFTRTFCEESRYFKPENGERVDAIRAEIDRLELRPR